MVNLGKLWREALRLRWPWIVVVLLLAIGLRLYHLGAQSLWNDEGNTVRLIERVPADLITAAGLDIHPPGYYLLLKIWASLIGESEFALRALSALAGLIIAACAYALGRKLFARGVGLLAALFTAVNTFSIYYGQEARMYALLAALAAASMLVFVYWLEATQRGSRRLIALSVALALLNAMGLYTHYAYPVVMLVEGLLCVLWLIAHPRAAVRPLLWFVALNVLTLILFAPQLGTAIRQVTGWPRTGQDIAVGDGLLTIARWLIYGNTLLDSPKQAVNGSIYIWPALFMLAGLLPDWLKYPRSALPRWWRQMLPVLWIVVPIGGFLALGLFREANLKFLLPVQIATALLIARGIWLLWESGSANLVVLVEAIPRVVAAFGFIALLNLALPAVGNAYHNVAYFRDDYRAMAQIISTEGRDGDAIILDAPNQEEVFTYYYHGPLPIYPLPAGLGGDDAATQSATEQIATAHRRLFVLYWGDSERDPRRMVEKTLTARTFEIDSGWYGNVRFTRYAAMPEIGASFPVNAQFGPSIVLQDAALSSRTPSRGDVLGVAFTWLTRAKIDTRYRVTVQLLDAGGRLITQRDAEPGNNMALTTTWVPNQPVKDTHGLVIPASTAPGEYTLIVALYDLNQPATRLMVAGKDYYEVARLTVQVK